MKKLKQQSFEVNFSSLLTAFDMRNSLALTNNRFHVEVTVRNKKIPHSFFSRKLSFFFFLLSLYQSFSFFDNDAEKEKLHTKAHTLCESFEGNFSYFEAAKRIRNPCQSDDCCTESQKGQKMLTHQLLLLELLPFSYIQCV